MIKSNKKITITDVAKMAGVSKGTVDRVIHNRGEVSEASKKKVLEVVDRIGYQANLYASMLASKKHYRVVCFTPRSQSGEYWSLVNDGIDKGTVRASEFNLDVQVVDYDQFDIHSFRTAAREMLDLDPQAVVLAPLFHDDTIDICRELDLREVPYVFIDSRMEATDYLAYYGMPMKASGILCASLLELKPEDRKIAHFRIERGNDRLSDPTIRRREGFMEYIKNNFPQCEVVNTFISPYDDGHNFRVFDEFFEKNPDIRHIVTFNSRAHLIASYFRARGIRDKKFIGFDLLDSNVAALREGYISGLIVQRTRLQVYMAINALIDFLIMKKSPAKRDNFMSMDILTRYNVDFYSDMAQN